MRSQVESSLRLQLSNQSVEVYYQSVNHLEPQISLSHEWGYWSPRNGSRFFSVQVQKFHDFLFSTVLDSGDNVNARLGCENEITYVHEERFPCCAIRWMKLILYSTLSSSFFVSTCSNKHSQFTRWVYLTSHEKNRKPLHWLKEIVKSEPENKVDTKQKKQLEEL